MPLMRLQYIFNNKSVGITEVIFSNISPIKSVEKVAYFKELNLTGNWLTKQYRYSWDKSSWSAWNTLTQQALIGINFQDHPDFYLELKYTRATFASADIGDWYLYYDTWVTSEVDPSTGPIDADLLQGQPGSYYLDGANAFGPVPNISFENIWSPDNSLGGVYSHRVDTSANTTVFFRTIEGEYGITVRDDASRGTVVISADVSLGGMLNVGTGDASVYAGVDLGGSNLFREIRGSSGIVVSTSENTIILDGAGSSVDGGVWITNITPTSGGNVGDKAYSSDGNVLDSCLTDATALTVHVLALPGHTNYKPVVSINSNPVSLSANPDKPLWEGTYNLVYDSADASIVVVHEDGASWKTIVAGDSPAVIESANFIGTYPGSQTELKAGDTMQINVVTDVSITSIAWLGTEAITSGSFSASGSDNTFTVTIADRGDTATLRGFTLNVTTSTGSTSANYVSTSHGTVELTDVVNCNDLRPTVSFGSVTYPASQTAIKSGESATVANVVADYDSVLYSSPTNELTITNTGTVENPKTVTYLAGTYNITTDNIRAVAHRDANNSTTTGNGRVWIAASAFTLNVSTQSARLRSGGNDGTSEQSHTITITSSQNLAFAPDVDHDTGGEWVRTSFAGGPLVWTKTLQVHDDMEKGAYNWSNITGTNLAGTTVTTITGPTGYVLGGFVLRTITMLGFQSSAEINVQISDYSKLSSAGGSNDNLEWSVITLTTRAAQNTTAPPAVPFQWSAGSYFQNPSTIRILDTEATGSSSQASTFTIQESI